MSSDRGSEKAVDAAIDGSQREAAVAIRVRDVSKCYQIYERPEDRLKQAILPRVQRLLGRPASTHFREFWALRDVSFEVRRGQTLGVIGRNGSGKSTLLQIICGTRTPTGGSVAVDGRVAALLELGSGFNPEFTGRENIYMSGAVLGLTREQVDARYDDIVAFAEIGDFIGQPVKTYSSGMYVRLAFAVIAHADADILVIDEALSVGDAIFTQKCRRFLRSFIERGTLVFVSHDMGSVLSLCQTCIWMDQGRLRMHGNAKEVVNAYSRDCMEAVTGRGLVYETLAGSDPTGRSDLAPEPEADVLVPEVRASFFANILNAEGWKSGHAELVSIRITDASGAALTNFSGGETLELTIRAVAYTELASPIIGFVVKDRHGQSLFGENTWASSEVVPVDQGQVLAARFVFALPLLPTGEYTVTAAIADGTAHSHVQHHWLHDAAVLKVVSERERYGLVGIPFRHVGLRVDRDGDRDRGDAA